MIQEKQKYEIELCKLNQWLEILFTFPTQIPTNHNEMLLRVDDPMGKYSNHENVIPNKRCKATREKEISLNQKIKRVNQKWETKWWYKGSDCLPFWWQWWKFVTKWEEEIWEGPLEKDWRNPWFLFWLISKNLALYL